MPNPSDRELVEKAVAGDMQAFRQLVEKHQRFAYSLSHRLVGTVGDAEDITQEAFIRLWKHLSRYRHEIKLTTWLYKIVTNLCLDFLRSTYSRNSKRTVDVTVQTGAASGRPSDDAVENEEFRVALQRITAHLSPKQKAVFVLRDMEGLSVQEVEGILAMSPAKVKSNLFYARKKVSEHISAYYQTKKPVKP